MVTVIGADVQWWDSDDHAGAWRPKRTRRARFRERGRQKAMWKRAAHIMGNVPCGVVQMMMRGGMVRVSMPEARPLRVVRFGHGAEPASPETIAAVDALTRAALEQVRETTTGPGMPGPDLVGLSQVARGDSEVAEDGGVAEALAEWRAGLDAAREAFQPTALFDADAPENRAAVERWYAENARMPLQPYQRSVLTGLNAPAKGPRSYVLDSAEMVVDGVSHQVAMTIRPPALEVAKRYGELQEAELQHAQDRRDLHELVATFVHTPRKHRGRRRVP